MEEGKLQLIGQVFSQVVDHEVLHILLTVLIGKYDKQ